MNTAPDLSVTQRRKTPEAWPTLYALAETVADQEGNDRASIDAAHDLIAATCDFDKFEIDENRYYAIGLTLCEFARTLKPKLEDETSRCKIVDCGAKIMLRRYMEDKPIAEYPPGATGKEYSAYGLVLRDADYSIAPYFDQATEPMPKPVQIIGNALLRTVTMRPGDISNEYELKQFEDAAAYATIFHPNFLKSLRGDLFAGLNVFDDIIFKHHMETGVKTVLPNRDDINLLRHPSTLRMLRGMSARTPLYFLEPSLIHRNIQFTQKDSQTTLAPFDWTGEYVKRQQKIKDEFKDSPFYKSRRTKELVCPATSIPVMFPMMSELAIDMLEKTIDLREQKWHPTT